MIKLSDIKVGDIVQLRPNFGTGRPIEAKVDGVHLNIKNGMPGIDYHQVEGSFSWAYLDQVDKVVRK